MRASSDGSADPLGGPEPDGTGPPAAEPQAATWAVPPAGAGPGDEEPPADTGRGPVRAPLGAAVATFAVIVIGALVDPSGLLAPVAWGGARPAAQAWTWLQYVLFVPLIVLAVWWTARTLLRRATPAAPRHWVLTRVWVLVVLSSMTAKLLYSAVLMAPALIDGTEAGLAPGPSWAYLIWSTGFAGVKALAHGWLPAAVAALLWAPGGAQRSGVADLAEQPTRATVPATAIALALALLGAWVARYWWTGSPVGYAHVSGWRLLAPSPAAGLGGQVAALLIVALVVAGSGRRTLRRVPTPRSGGARVVAGAIAAVAAGFVLVLVQSVVHLVFGTDVPGDGDAWVLPASYLRLVEGLSFGLLMAPFVAFGFWLMPRSPRPDRSWAFGLAASVLVIGAVVLVARQEPGPPEVPSLAGADPAPVSLPARPAATPGSPTPLSPVTVRRDADGAAVLADQFGAQVIARGVNVNQLGQYYSPDPQVSAVLQLTEGDFADIAAMGFNTVRLVLSWSALEPEPGLIDTIEIDRAKQAVAWAAQYGIRVVLDLHQDAWGMDVRATEGTECRTGTAPMTGWDGAPEWASYFDAAPPCQFRGRDLAPNVLRAFTSFYTDRESVQQALVEVWSRLADEFAADPAVLGYDLLNEPSFAEQPPLTSGMLLGGYHARAISAIRAAERRAPGGYAHPIFVEPSIWWSGFGVDPLPPHGFTADPQLVFSPHLYQESITVDQDWGITLVGIERGYALAARAAARWGTPLWVGEWGFFDDPLANLERSRRFAAAEDDLRVGSAVWVWKMGCGDPHSYPADVVGHIRRTACPQATQMPTRNAELQPLRRPYPRSAPGRIEAIDTEGGRLRLDGTTQGAGPVDGSPDPCSLDVWFPGAGEPRVVDSVGVDRLRLVQVPEGSAPQDPSGGWRVIGCATGGPYRLTLS